MWSGYEYLIRFALLAFVPDSPLGFIVVYIKMMMRAAKCTEILHVVACLLP